MKQLICLIFLLFTANAAAQSYMKYHYVTQKDSFYYLATSEGVMKFSSFEANGTFYFLDSIKKNLTKPSLLLQENYLLIQDNDTVFCYKDETKKLSFLGHYIPSFQTISWHSFGPYFFFRFGTESKSYYKLMRIDDGIIRTVTDTLFVHPQQRLVFFTYPYVVNNGTVYKYVENYDFYPVGQVGCGNVKTGIYENELICHLYYRINMYDPPISRRYTYKIIEPDFPMQIIENWGANISYLQGLCGTLIPTKYLLYFDCPKVIVTRSAQVVYVPTLNEKISVTDYYIFKTGESLLFSKWNAGTVFYQFTWNNLTSIEGNETELSFSLSQNYPNPFNPTTKIKYSLPHSSKVMLKVLDVLGKEIVALVNEEKAPGEYEIDFDAAKYNLSSGVYFYRIAIHPDQLTAGEFVKTNKMILMR